LSVASGASSAVPAAAATTSITNYHFDPAHTGNDTGEPPMAGLAPSWSSAILGGRVYGEPLVLNNTVYVATQMNTIYALDAAGGSTLWSLSLGLLPVPLGIKATPNSGVHSAAQIGDGCGNVNPLGVTGTPVIDAARGTAGTLFAVAETWDGATDASIEHQLVAVDLASHAVSHQNIDPVGVNFDTGATRALEQERGALALAGGNVIVPFGGMTGDCGSYHGFVVSLPENLIGTAATFEVNAPTAGVNANNRAGGIWGAGGPAVDASGNIYVSTGNGFQPPTSTYEYTDGVVKLNSSMVVQDFFGPTVWRADDTADKDLGSQGPLLIPRLAGNPMVFTTGKQLTGYLLDSGALSSTPTTHIGGELFKATACDQESFGASAYMATSTTAGYLYVPCREGLRALTVNSSAPSFARTWQGPGDATGPPIVAGGLVWVHGNGKLYGLDPTSGATTVTLSGVDTSYNFSTPSASGGTLFYAGNNQVRAFSTGCSQASTDQWSGWTPLQGAASGRVAVAKNQDGRLEAFVRNADGAIWHAWQLTPNAGWSAWYSLGGNPAADPQLGRNKDGRLEAFAVGTDGGLWHAWQLAPNSGWSGWLPLGGSLAGRPAVIANQDGRLEAVVRGSDNSAWHVWQVVPNGGWSSMTSLGGGITNDPAVTSDSDGRIEAFLRGADGGSWHIYQVAPNLGWSAWSALGGAVSGSPAAAANSDGRLQVFVRGADNSLYYARQTSPGSGWSGFAFVAGPLSGDPAVGRNLDGRLEVFAADAGGQLRHSWQSAAGADMVCWVPTAAFTSGGVPDVGANADGRLELFDRASDAGIWHDWQIVPNGGWS
jgi:hypothetical protein